jgi:hypothetical protein
MAKGSHTAWDGHPRVCAGCGKPLRISKDVVCRHAVVLADGSARLSSWHFSPCWITRHVCQQERR